MPRQTFLLLVSVLLASPVLAAEHDGAEPYRVQCASCHGADGRGDTPGTGVQGFFIGNTAENVLQHVDCSVLAVKPKGFVTPVKM